MRCTSTQSTYVTLATMASSTVLYKLPRSFLHLKGKEIPEEAEDVPKEVQDGT